MHRRRFLAAAPGALAAGIAGCLSNESDEESGTSGGSDPDESAFERFAAVTTADESPDAAPITFDITATRHRITDDATAVFTVETTNVGEGRLSVRMPVYKEISARSEDARVLLLSPDAPDSPPRGYAPDCSGDPNGRRTSTSTYEAPPTHGLDAGATAKDELLLVNHLETDGCLPPGTYRFDCESVVHESDEQAYQGASLEWGFGVEIADASPS